MDTTLLDEKLALLKERPSANLTAIDAIHEWLLAQEPPQRNRISPYVVSCKVGLGMDVLVPEFLYGVPLGLFDLFWEVRCPHCNMATTEYTHLSQVTDASYCPMCDLTFKSDFAHSFEVMFSLHKAIEDLSLPIPCWPPPALKLYLRMYTTYQQTISGEVYLVPGRYRYFCPITYARGILEVAGEATESLQRFQITQLAGAHQDPPALAARPGPYQFDFTNTAHPLAGFYVTDWELARLKPEEIPVRLTGLEVIHYPAFAELFGAQVLSKREQVRIASVTTVFTDIIGSTQMYEAFGDPFAYNLVRDHFEVLFEAITKHHGIVLKVIGDAVMASFTTNQAAGRSVLEMLNALAQYNAGRSESNQIHIRVGLHCGPAILVRLNGHLDYFGATINKAARIQAEARGNEVLFSREVYEDATFRQVLAEAGITQIRKQSVYLKGIGPKQALYRAVVG